MKTRADALKYVRSGGQAKTSESELRLYLDRGGKLEPGFDAMWRGSPGCNFVSGGFLADRPTSEVPPAVGAPAGREGGRSKLLGELQTQETSTGSDLWLIRGRLASPSRGLDSVQT